MSSALKMYLYGWCAIHLFVVISFACLLCIFLAIYIRPRNQFHPFINARHKSFTVTMTVATIVLLLFHQTGMAISRTLNLHERENDPNWVTLIWLVSVPNLALFVGGYFWLSHFDIMHNIALSHERWIVCINSNTKISFLKTHLFYIKYRTTLGNEKYLFTRFLMLGGFLSIILIGLFVVSQSIGQALLNVWFLIVLVCIAIIRKRTPAYDDRMYLRQEARLFVRWVLCGCAFLIVHSVLRNLRGTIGNVYLYAGLPTATIAIILVGTGFLCPVGWVLYRVRFERRIRGLTLHSGQPSHMSMSSTLGRGGRSNTLSVTGTSASLREVLRDDAGFRLFMDHVFKEFSQENLLCVLELSKFREIHTPLDTDDMNGVPSAPHTPSIHKKSSHHSPVPPIKSPFRSIKFPANIEAIPSSIIANNKSDVGKQVTLLFEKYISKDAEMCCNLPFKARALVEQVSTLCQDGMDIADIEDEIGMPFYTVFDDVLRELLKLLLDSFTRFAGTDEFPEPEIPDP